MIYAYIYIIIYIYVRVIPSLRAWGFGSNFHGFHSGKPVRITLTYTNNDGHDFMSLTIGDLYKPIRMVSFNSIYLLTYASSG